MNGHACDDDPEFVAELFELLEEGVVLHDSNGRVRACNAAAARMLAWPAFGDQGAHSLFAEIEATLESGEPLTREDEPTRRVLATGVAHEARVRVRRADGETAWLLVKSVPLRRARREGGVRSGALGGALTVLRDMTEHMLVEERVRGQLPADSFSELAGSIAHDFSHFLTVIVGYSDLIAVSLPPTDPVREQAEHIRAAATGAARLTGELVDFARRQRHSANEADVSRTLQEMQPMLARLLGPRIRLSLDLDPSATVVRADPIQLERAIFNLALNARDAMRAGGSLRVVTHAVTIDEEFVRTHPGAQPGAFVRLVVADEGAGMTEETRRRLFEPFFTTKPPGQGTGLGLATVWGIVKQFGGYIDVDSAPGRGAEFRIDLPAVSLGSGEASSVRPAEKG
ncbi:MAG: PAS domain-containing protein [Candidatus Eisenbacteria bacterium]|uniref:histidine kinase n=1 Tax=Eiseniibacteriota bacterium TaxID=2212470 RepID=A0A933SH61_UNCEI|nr:PAS domain-containing protein [Candidatus Eisenbacteria bacterium]